MYLVQLVDALFHAADGSHRSQSVSVEVSEAVLPADLEQSHHSTFLFANGKHHFIYSHQERQLLRLRANRFVKLSLHAY